VRELGEDLGHHIGGDVIHFLAGADDVGVMIDRALLGFSSDVSLAELANILATAPIVSDSKIRRAMNLDGGSSSAFWFAREDGSTFSIAGRKPVRDFVAVVPK